MVRAIASAPSWYEMACGLLEVWRSRDKGHVSWRADSDDGVYDRGAEWRADAQSLVERMAVSGPSDADREALVQMAKTGRSPLDAAYDLGWVIDARFWPTFTDSWVADRENFILGTGEFFPTVDAPLELLPVQPPTSRPWALDPPRDELCHVRVMRSHPGFAVRIDARVSATLDSILLAARRLVAVQPNDSLAEIAVPRGPRFHGVQPADPVRQSRILVDICTQALSEAEIVVVPECAVTRSIVTDLQRVVDASALDRLLVAGSVHETVRGKRRNVAYALLPDEPEPLTHDKFVPYQSDTDLEDIEPDDPATITVYMSNRCRLAIGICKDLFNDEAVGVLGRVGVNLVLVPAMSGKTDGFAAQLGRLVSLAQTVGVVANNPRTWRDRSGRALHPAAAVFSQPLEGHPMVVWPSGSGDSALPPGYCTLDLGEASARFVHRHIV
jgi:predicted amidohydrolase